MNLTLDIGNTRTKWALFQEDTLSDHGVTTTEGLAHLCGQVAWQRAIVCASGNADLRPLTLTGRPVHLLSHTSKLPIAIDYATPETLGADRIASACGAWRLHPYANSLIIDAGTCITVDFVDASGTYRGGAILPGIDMKFHALHTFTARLPLLENVTGEQNVVTGRSTDQSITAGVLTATRFGVEGFVRHYRSLHGLVNVLVTGGDAERLVEEGSLARLTVERHPNLVMTGLNEILKENEK